jgi:hypothetical protein
MALPGNQDPHIIGFPLPFRQFTDITLGARHSLSADAVKDTHVQTVRSEKCE